MIGNIFTGSTEKDPQLPKDVKDAISKCRGAVQKGLEDRISRMVSIRECKGTSPTSSNAQLILDHLFLHT